MNRSLSSLIVSLLIYCMVLTPCMSAAQLVGGVDASSTQPKIALSDVATTAATVNLVALFNKLQDGTAQAADVRGARVALATAFAQMQQTGANDQYTAQILAQEDSFLNKGISEEQIQQHINSLTAMGAQINPNQYRNTLFSTRQQRLTILANLKKNGIWGMEQRLLSSLQTLESTLQSRGPTSAGLRLSSAYNSGGESLRLLEYQRNGAPRAHLQRVDCNTLAAVYGICFILVPNPLFAIAAIAAAWAAGEGYC
jgi:hypothetical protein